MVVGGAAFALAFPAKQAFLVQVTPRRRLGTVQGLEQTAMQGAALVGTLTAPLLYGLVGGAVFVVGGGVALAGLAIAAPTLRREWRCVAEGDRCAELRPRAARRSRERRGPRVGRPAGGSPAGPLPEATGATYTGARRLEPAHLDVQRRRAARGETGGADEPHHLLDGDGVAHARRPRPPGATSP